MSEILYTHDCRNGHHGAFCGMTPCDCVCHVNERPAARPQTSPEDAVRLTGQEPEL